MSEPETLYDFEIVQNGIVVASACSSDLEAAMREALHYAAVYRQDGPVVIRLADLTDGDWETVSGPAW